MNCIVEFKK